MSGDMRPSRSSRSVPRGLPAASDEVGGRGPAASARGCCARSVRTESGQDGSMAFSEFSSTDPAKTRSFLEKVFGWRFESVQFPMGEYLSFRTPGGGQGGIRPAQAKEVPGSTSYVRVDDLDAARKKVERARGEIVLPRVDVPGMGSFFWFRAPGGPILAAWQDAPALPTERE